MKIGILGAMLEEVSSIKELMQVKKETTIAGRTYSEGVINDKEVIVVFSRWGKVASACTTATLINEFKADFVLFTGVAGAVDSNLNIGDIIIAHGLFQHDMDARPFFDQFQIPLTSTILFKPNATGIEYAKQAADSFTNEIEVFFDKDLLKKYAIISPSVHIGLIASGDKFIADPQEHGDLVFYNKENKTLAVEMEGAAVAQVCEDHNIPYTIMRIISDKADHSAAIDFQAFITDIASKYSAEMVKRYLNNIAH